ncbi:MAG: CpaE family protein, partial [Rubrimonas sp.]
MAAVTARTEATRAAPDAARVDVAAFVRDSESQAFLEEYLRDASLGRPAVAAGGVEAAVRFLERAQQPPRVLLVDLSGVDTPLSAIDELAEVCEPSIVVVAIGDRDNVHLFRELIRAGVADYVTKPLAPELLDPYVRRGRAQISADGQPARRGKIVAFAGARGGVGATTLAVGAAWRLANQQKRRVALVDLDMHGGAACVQLGLQPGGLRDALLNHRRLDAMFMDRTLIRSGERLSVLAEELPLDADAAIDPAALDEVLATLANDYHYVIVDLPRAFGSLHAHVFRAARLRAVIVDRTLPALRDGARLLDAAREHGESALLVVNDHHPGLKSIITADEIARALGRSPDVEIAYDRSAANRADNLGEPLAAGSGAMAAGADALVAALAGRQRARA